MPPSSGRQHDISKDWQLDEANFSPKAQRIVLAMVASLAFSTSLTSKINRSIIIDSSRVDASLPFVFAASRDTKAYHERMSSLDWEMKQDMWPPYILVWLNLAIFIRTIVKEHLDEGSSDRADIVSYVDSLTPMSGAMQALAICSQVRFCRLRTTFSKKLRILEVGVGVMEPRAADTWHTGRALREENYSLKVMRGIAPKNGLEKRIEATLRKLKVFAPRDQ